MTHSLIVSAFHGTSQKSADAILEPGKNHPERFVFSENDDDWLGDGVYFFQDAPFRAREWPKVRKPLDRRTENPVVIRGEIDLTNCLDFFDIIAAQDIAPFRNEFMEVYHRTDTPLPINSNRGWHRLDCAFINFVVSRLEANGRRVDTVRAPFVEGSAVLEGSHIYTHAHVQVVIRPFRMDAVKSLELYKF